MTKLTIFLVFMTLHLTGIYAVDATNDTEDNEIRFVKLPPIFQLPVYKKILSRRNIAPEVREEDVQDKPVPKSIIDPVLSYPGKTSFNSGFANITNGIIKPWMHFNNRLAMQASTLPDTFAAKGAMIGSAIATPIRMYTYIVNEFARSLSSQSLSPTRQTSIFDLPIDPRVSHIEPDHNAVLMAIQNNAERIGKHIVQMGHEIKNTGKNISNVGVNLLEFSKKATETLSKTPRFPSISEEQSVPIGLEPSVNEFLKLNSSVPTVSSENATLIPETFEVSSMAGELAVLNKSENVQPIAEVNTKVPFFPIPAISELKITKTVSPALQAVLVSEVPVTPVLNIVNEEESSAEIITEPSVPAAAVVTTMEVLAPAASSSLATVESLNATEIHSSKAALNISNAQITEVASTELLAKATESSLFSEAQKLNSVKAELQRVDSKPDTADSTDAQNDKVITVDTLVSTVNL